MLITKEAMAFSARGIRDDDFPATFEDSDKVVQHEQKLLLAKVLECLPDDYREVISL